MDRRYNELPPNWDVTPHALLGIVGAEKYHESMRAALLHQSRTADKSQAGSLKAFDAISLDDNFTIPPKSSPSVGIKRFKTPIRGLLKTNWMEKWHSRIPGLILLMVDLSKAGRNWEEQETFICSQVDKLRQKTLERRINVAVILVLSSSDNVRDEYLFSLRKRGSLDTKQVYKLTVRELAKPDCAMVSKTWKNAQEMLVSFYQNAIRKYTKHLKVVKPPYLPLQARHTFKIAYFLEVLGDRHKAHQRYRTAMRIATAIHNAKLFDVEQVKVFAALAMWRIYSRTLRDKKAVDAHRSEIFRGFLLHFRKRVGSCRYRHFGWLAQQCLVFARHLDSFDEASSILEKPVHFRNLAVQYAVEQRRAAQAAGVYRSEMMMKKKKRAGSDGDSGGGGGGGRGAREGGEAEDQQFTIQPPEFVGGQPTVVATATGEPFGTSGEHGAFHALERLIDHSTNIKAVLSECIAYEERAFQAKRAAAMSPRRRTPKGKGAGKKSKQQQQQQAKRSLVPTSGPLAHITRSLARKKCVMADECVHSEDFAGALSLLQQVLPLYEDGRWPSLARFVLERLQRTAKQCGNHALYVRCVLLCVCNAPCALISLLVCLHGVPGCSMAPRVPSG